MKRWLSRLAVPAIAIAYAGASPSARADDLQYYTIGFFNADTPTVNGSDTESAEALTVGDVTLNYFNNTVPTNTGAGGIHGITFLGPVANSDFGEFTITTTGSTAESFTGNTFTLQIYQILPPVSGHADLAAVISGSLSTNGSNTTLTWTPTMVVLGGTTYSIANLGGSNLLPDQMLIANSSNNHTTTIGAEITMAPLPATASMGLGLFGVIGAVGGLNALRRRRAAAAL